jgi:hypothetical protein
VSNENGNHAKRRFNNDDGGKATTNTCKRSRTCTSWESLPDDLPVVRTKENGMTNKRKMERDQGEEKRGERHKEKRLKLEDSDANGLAMADHGSSAPSVV